MRGRLNLLRRFARAGIALAFVFQAAHQPAADPGNFRGIEGEILFLRHADGHRLEVAEEHRAAQRPAAAAHAAHELRLVAHANLSELDARAKHGGQILDELAEVNAPVRREVEDDLIQVERALDIDEFHRQAMQLDLLLADLERLYALLTPGGMLLLPVRNPVSAYELTSLMDRGTRDLYSGAHEVKSYRIIPGEQLFSAIHTHPYLRPYKLYKIIYESDMPLVERMTALQATNGSSAEPEEQLLSVRMFYLGLFKEN